MAIIALSIGSIALIGLLIAESKERLLWRGMFKTVASSCFLLLAVSWGALDSDYGKVIFVGMILCWLGDVLLIKTGQGVMFMLGIGAFLFAHIAYAYAFTQVPLNKSIMLIALVLSAIAAWPIARYLAPHLDQTMRYAVSAYVVAISAMVICAAGTTYLALASAVAFAASDLSVARDRFIAPGFSNVSWGLPLYYLSQVGIAATLLH